MAKVIKYKFLSCEVNHGTGEKPVMEQIILGKTIECPSQAAYDANYPIAEKEAIAGTIEVSGEFDPEPEAPRTDAERIDELEEALNMILNGVTE